MLARLSNHNSIDSYSYSSSYDSNSITTLEDIIQNRLLNDGELNQENVAELFVQKLKEQEQQKIEEIERKALEEKNERLAKFAQKIDINQISSAVTPIITDGGGHKYNELITEKKIETITENKEIITEVRKEEVPENLRDTSVKNLNNIKETEQKAKKLSDIQKDLDYEKVKNKKVQEKIGEVNYTVEYLKCRLSPLYFIENYISIPVAGGMVKIKESEQWNKTNKYKFVVELFHQHDAVLYLSSRQSGKTTTSAMYLLWCMIFFPKMQISYLTLDKMRALDMISRMKEMMDSLPDWLKVPPKQKAERLTYYELSNGSKITASFVSGANDPDKVGRGLSSPLVFIDETAFINHAETVWGALQPTVSAAKKHAKKNGYPNGVIFTSTPNGASGKGQFFYEMYKNSVKFEDIYNMEQGCLYPDYLSEFKKEGKNAFISIVLHWSEFRDQEWYEDQKKEMNFNQRKINQELDLHFLGSDTTIFSDEVISKMVPKKEIHRMQLPYGQHFNLHHEIDPLKRYILGVDTAASIGANSDYSALVLMEAESGRVVGTWKGRFAIVKQFAQLVKFLIKSLDILYGLDDYSLRVAIERNSYGKETVEELWFDAGEYNYGEYLFFETLANGDEVPGIWTSNNGKMGNGKRDQMFNELMNIVNERPHNLDDRDLIDELKNLEQKSNGRIEACKNMHDDLVMAYNFCLYVRRLWINSGVIKVSGEVMKQPKVSKQQINTILHTGNTISVNNPAIQISMSKMINEEDSDILQKTEKRNKSSVSLVPVSVGNGPEIYEVKQTSKVNLENFFIC